MIKLPLFVFIAGLTVLLTGCGDEEQPPQAPPGSIPTESKAASSRCSWGVADAVACPPAKK